MKVEVIDRKQGNGYDKILKENIEAALPVIMENVLSLDIAESMEIPDSIQYTKERNPDVLKKVTDRENNTFVLHLEWQSQHDKDMVYRMAEYAVMLHRKYRMPVKQYVILTGKSGVKMITEIKQENLQFRYKLIDLKNFDYKLFLNAEDPAIKVFSILCNFEKDGEEKAVENIFNAVKAADAKGLTGEKHYNQLRILVKLRNKNINLKFNNMLPENFYEKLAEKDPLFKKGQIKGKKEGERKGERKGRILGRRKRDEEIARKLKLRGFDKELIAEITELPIEKIEKIKTI